MKKKLLSVVLAVAMVATLLTGCGAKKEAAAGAAGGDLADKKVGVCIYLNQPWFL